jgi:predicted HD superfamily hydrolase involved in NAD metabolism
MIKVEVMEWLEERLDAKLYRHSVATQELAAKLADVYSADGQKAALAGLLHDCAKPFSNSELVLQAKRHSIPLDEIRLMQPGLLHAPVAAKLVQMELGISDNEILHAIAVHNTGSKGMSRLDKVLYLADASEPNRDYPGVQRIRSLALDGDLDRAVLETMDMKIRHVIQKRAMLHPMSVEARNDILKLKVEPQMNTDKHR